LVILQIWYDPFSTLVFIVSWVFCWFNLSSGIKFELKVATLLVCYLLLKGRNRFCLISFWALKFSFVFIIFYVKMGTGFSILISKRNPSLVTTFGLLSCGYLMSSYQEVESSSVSSISLFMYLGFSWFIAQKTWLCPLQVRSVVLHTLNRARFTVAVESFLKTGKLCHFASMHLSVLLELWFPTPFEVCHIQTSQIELSIYLQGGFPHCRKVISKKRYSLFHGWMIGQWCLVCVIKHSI